MPLGGDAAARLGRLGIFADLPESELRDVAAELDERSFPEGGWVLRQGEKSTLEKLFTEGDVHVIRSHVADGHDPEVFHVDLRAIADGKDTSTNVRLRPFDQVYVGQTRKAALERCVPPWLRPAYEAVFGMRRD